jgi:glycosyltransferase involved in cell wall biosynthesis
MSSHTFEKLVDPSAEITPRPKLKVAINAITQLTPKYGSRVYLLALAQAISELPGIELLLLVGKAQTGYLPYSLQRLAKEVDIPVGRSYWQSLLQYRIDRCLQEANVDIYHLPNTSPLLPKGTKTVVTIHDLVDLRIRKYGLARTLYRRVINYSAAHIANRVLTVSNNSKRDLVDLLSIPEDKITVIYPGVDQIFRSLDRNECRAFLKSRHSVTKSFILAPGGLSRNKNVYGLLSAFAQLQSRGISDLLVFTGEVEGQEMRSIVGAITKLRLSDRVIFTGHVPAGDLPYFYNASSAVAYVSLYEGFGLPILEAMASGAPVVVSMTSSMPEVAGDATLQVNPHDPHAIAEALERVLLSPELRKDLISRGFKRARAFSWNHTAVQTLNAYRQTVHHTCS